MEDQVRAALRAAIIRVEFVRTPEDLEREQRYLDIFYDPDLPRDALGRPKTLPARRPNTHGGDAMVDRLLSILRGAGVDV